jgi:hypothetical protein
MSEIIELITSLAKKVGELAIANKELADENARLLRQIEGMRPFVKADADASATVAKNKKHDG